MGSLMGIAQQPSVRNNIFSAMKPNGRAKSTKAQGFSNIRRLPLAQDLMIELASVYFPHYNNQNSYQRFKKRSKL